MKKLGALPFFCLVVLFLMFVVLGVVLAAESDIQRCVIVVSAIPPTDGSVTNPDYALLNAFRFVTRM